MAGCDHIIHQKHSSPGNFARRIVSAVFTLHDALPGGCDTSSGGKLLVARHRVDNWKA
jgi:hypothetical protein